MEVTARELGSFEIPEEARVYLPHGLLGFENLHRFALVDCEDFRPFALLISEEDPDVAFAVADVERFGADAASIHLSPSDETALDLEDSDAIAVLVILSVADDSPQATGNLRAPIVMNTRNRVARQVIVYGTGLSMRQPLQPRVCIPVLSAATSSSPQASPGKGKFACSS
jgi:flagellar assembly factor FliW